MGVRKDEDKPTISELILKSYLKWCGKKDKDVTKQYARASRIAAQYNENELRLALVMRSSYDRELRESEK